MKFFLIINITLLLLGCKSINVSYNKEWSDNLDFYYITRGENEDNYLIEEEHIKVIIQSNLDENDLIIFNIINEFDGELTNCNFPMKCHELFLWTHNISYYFYMNDKIYILPKNSEYSYDFLFISKINKKFYLHFTNEFDFNWNDLNFKKLKGYNLLPKSEMIELKIQKNVTR